MLTMIGYFSYGMLFVKFMRQAMDTNGDGSLSLEDEAKWGPVGPGARHENPRKLISDPNKIYDVILDSQDISSYKMI